MTAVFLSCAVSFVVSVTIIPVVSRFAKTGRLIDLPGERSSHEKPTARTGGVGIVAGALMGLAAATAFAGEPLDREHWLIAAALVGGAAVGFADDLIKLRTAVRLSLYLGLSAAISASAISVSVLEVPGGFTIKMSAVAAIVFSTLLIAWYANLFNFMDGIDGIAGCTAVVTMGSFLYLFFSNGEYVLGSFALCVAASSTGFLFYNFPPAKLFMGDVGSVFLGMTAGALTVAAIGMQIASPAAAVLLMLPFVFDATFTLIRRVVSRERFWKAHRTHIYQQMCDLGLSHRTVTLAYTSAAIIFALIGVNFDKMSEHTQPLVFWSCIAFAIGASVLVLRKNATGAEGDR